MLCLNADGVVLKECAHLVFLGYGIQNFVVGIHHTAIGVHEFVHHLLRHDCVLWQFLYYGVLHAMYALTSDAYIHLRYFCFKSVL